MIAHQQKGVYIHKFYHPVTHQPMYRYIGIGILKQTFGSYKYERPYETFSLLSKGKYHNPNVEKIFDFCGLENIRIRMKTFSFAIMIHDGSRRHLEKMAIMLHIESSDMALLNHNHNRISTHSQEVDEFCESLEPQNILAKPWSKNEVRFQKQNALRVKIPCIFENQAHTDMYDLLKQRGISLLRGLRMAGSVEISDIWIQIEAGFKYHFELCKQKPCSFGGVIYKDLNELQRVKFSTVHPHVVIHSMLRVNVKSQC
ncbi:MAG: hypothetical protein WA948_12215 [Pontixanthobacter sp.]